ncbi:MAG: protein phosphatase 2C domain-containing protein [Proteobacteria bacterium]|nr:protein phosphatase 2C domain-containing protein [Pseudomonadota bacterium]MBU1060897.1 protein phosphatase 2C domain-containing protein [Pseudomonadota bacterium]
MFFLSPEHSICENRQQAAIRAVRTLHEQGSGKTNEDILLQDGNLYGVFDGATSLGDSPHTQSKTGGLLAAETAAGTFARNGNTLSRLGCLANRNIRQLMESSGVDFTQRRNIWSTSAAIVRIDGDEIEWFQVGDSLALLLYEDGSYRQLADPIDHDRDTLCLWKEMGPNSTGTIQENLADQILKVREGMNIHYGVMNGEPQAVDFFRHGRAPLTGVTDIILYTDGLFLPQTDPDQPADLETFVNLYRHGGLKQIRNLVRELQKDDPRCLNYPRFKQHDDIAAIALSFHEA